MPIYHISSNGDFLPVDIIYLPDNVDFVRRIDKCTALFRYLARGTRKIYHLGFIAENRAVGKCTAVEPQNTIIGYALNDKRSFEATLIGSDASTDIALLKIDAEKLPIVKFGDSDKLQVGEWVLAVGNPFQLNSTVTAGIVSAKSRNLGMLSPNSRLGIESFIQTDAAVNPGNSGGALVNTSGELVGINTAIYSETGNYAGYSFAIPTSIVSKVITDLKQYGTVQRALLCVSIMEMKDHLAKE